MENDKIFFVGILIGFALGGFIFSGIGVVTIDVKNRLIKSGGVIVFDQEFYRCKQVQIETERGEKKCSHFNKELKKKNF